MCGSMDFEEIDRICIHLRRPTPAVFVETGTFEGVTSEAAKRSGAFRRVLTVEASPALYNASRERLEALGVETFLGSSHEKLAEMLKTVREPAFIFLDAHYFEKPGMDGLIARSKLPLFLELEAIRPRPFADIVVVDDIHEFGRGPNGVDDWTHVKPETCARVLAYVDEYWELNDRLILPRSGLGLF